MRAKTAPGCLAHAMDTSYGFHASSLTASGGLWPTGQEAVNNPKKPALWAVSSTGMLGQGYGIARLDLSPGFHLPQHRLYFLPDPQEHGSFRPCFFAVLRTFG